ncbi:MAG: AbrB/MazE/SpoVT family DNA-binding domain-containing protein [Lachnospiraceae bacterium]|nr:AbrB/MazE/SpoVT family DNA-binding domain-containing protein [Lachnospiraceae bacterium]
MNIAVSKWGNSLGIRIPAAISEALGIEIGDSLNYELRGEEMILRKEASTAKMFEDFYGRPFEEITADVVGSGKEMDWGNDVGGEVL